MVASHWPRVHTLSKFNARYRRAAAVAENAAISTNMMPSRLRSEAAVTLLHRRKATGEHPVKTVGQAKETSNHLIDGALLSSKVRNIRGRGYAVMCA